MSLRKRTEGTSRLILFEVRNKLSNPDRSGITKAGEGSLEPARTPPSPVASVPRPSCATGERKGGGQEEGRGTRKLISGGAAKKTSGTLCALRTERNGPQQLLPRRGKGWKRPPHRIPGRSGQYVIRPTFLCRGTSTRAHLARSRDRVLEERPL